MQHVTVGDSTADLDIYCCGPSLFIQIIDRAKIHPVFLEHFAAEIQLLRDIAKDREAVFKKHNVDDTNAKQRLLEIWQGSAVSPSETAHTLWPQVWRLGALCRSIACTLWPEHYTELIADRHCKWPEASLMSRVAIPSSGSVLFVVVR